MKARPIPLWVLAAQAQHHGADERAAFACMARGAVDGREPAGLLVTCHRVELLGSGDGAAAGMVERTAGDGGIAGLQSYSGRSAAEHLFRLAAGLESAVTGEDEILHQVRGLLDAVRAASPVDAVLVRTLELAIAVGRRARAERSRPEERSLADRALDWVASRGVPVRGARALVAGAGVMGRALAVGAARRGAAVTVASRDPEHARELALVVDGSWLSLDEAAARGLATADVLLVALRGPWPGIERALDAPGFASPGAARARPGPPGTASVPLTADLSSPPVLPATARAALADRYTDVDRLFATRPAVGAEVERVRRAYVAHAEELVSEACDRLERWAAARPSVETLRALRTAAEERRARDLERLLRRLPDLEPRERALVTAFSEQLVAGILHQPSAMLHDDADGAAARAARLLFDL